MNMIPVKKFLELWDKIRELEWQQDGGLAKRVGITPAAIYKMREGLTDKVRPSIVRRIEDQLQYLIQLDQHGKWIIHPREKRESQAIAEYTVLEENSDAAYWKEQALKYKGEMEAVRRSLPSEVVEVILETAKKYDAHRGASKKQLSGKQ
jgi:DNA-binding Xre family transcriptional regulator